MESSKSLMDEDWDYLLVLDACRYDYFEKVYEDYFEGELGKVVSPGTETSEWCRKTFTGNYEDTVYVSGNPRINSKTKTKDFDARDHFHKIVDVWVWGWDADKGTVLPSVLNEALLEVSGDFPDKRVIGHYMQPHAPYLSLGPLEISGNKGAGRPLFSRKPLWRRIGSKLTRLVGQKRVWKLREIFGTQPETPMYSVFKENGEEGIKKVYEENLRRVLGEIARIWEKLSGKTVITSDHGELLGESGNFGHYHDYRKSQLTEIPWLVVEGVKKKLNTSRRSEKSRITNRVDELKRDSKI